MSELKTTLEKLRADARRLEEKLEAGVADPSRVEPRLRIRGRREKPGASKRDVHGLWEADDGVCPRLVVRTLQGAPPDL